MLSDVVANSRRQAILRSKQNSAKPLYRKNFDVVDVPQIVN
jgi:hypothetical protein